MQWVVLQLLLINVVPAVLEFPPCQRIAFDWRPSLQQLQVSPLSSMVPSPSIDHDIALQSLQRSVEGLNLQCILQRVWCTLEVCNCAAFVLFTEASTNAYVVKTVKRQGPSDTVP